MHEIWKSVVGYEGLYEVSNTGKVRSIDRSIAVKRLSKCSSVENYYANRVSTELKPYCVTKKGVKFHLHKRIAHGMGSHTQTDEYLYIEDMIKAAFDSKEGD